ncbi:MAG: sulfite exporter TauE/SafE family protein [Lachnospiraceae bacterium]|nr:sulfite exporter TauE/SafE family protein [Lachnospiraceae bacterium]
MLVVIETVIVLFFAFLIASVAGFAGVAIAVPLCSAIMGLTNAKVVVNIISIAFNSAIVFQHRKQLKIKELIPVLLLVMAGMVAGVFINKLVAAEEVLIKLLGVTILVISLIKLFYNKEIELGKIGGAVVLVLSGVISYLFLCGGIVMVLYMSTRYKEKDLFRAGNSFLFLVQSLYMTFILYEQSVYTTDNVMIGLIGVVPVIIATIIGKHILNVISQEKFEKVTCILLIIMAVMLMI